MQKRNEYYDTSRTREDMSSSETPTPMDSEPMIQWLPDRIPDERNSNRKASEIQVSYGNKNALRMLTSQRNRLGQ